MYSQLGAGGRKTNGAIQIDTPACSHSNIFPLRSRSNKALTSSLCIFAIINSDLLTDMKLVKNFQNQNIGTLSHSKFPALKRPHLVTIVDTHPEPTSVWRFDHETWTICHRKSHLNHTYQRIEAHHSLSQRGRPRWDCHP